jgi:hypothetical protein
MPFVNTSPHPDDFDESISASVGNVSGSFVNSGSFNFRGNNNEIHQHYVSEVKTTGNSGAKYATEPMWRSPFTQAVLGWVSLVLGVLSLVPAGTLLGAFGSGPVGIWVANLPQLAVFVALVLLVALFVGAVSLWNVARTQNRYPIVKNVAVSGFGHRITLEKIKPAPCPACRGILFYYNKPKTWVSQYNPSGVEKRTNVKRSPALECKRSAEHFYWVDVAEYETA